MARFRLTLALRAPPKGRSGPQRPRTLIIEHDAKSLDDLVDDLVNQPFLAARECEFDDDNQIKRLSPILIATGQIALVTLWRETRASTPAAAELPPDLSHFARIQKEIAA